MTRDEILERDAYREKITMRTAISHASLVFGNCSTQVGSADKWIEEHRKLAKEIFDLVESGRSIPSIAKEYDLTQKQVKQIIAMALLQKNRKEDDKPIERPPLKSKEEKEAEIAEIRKKRDSYKARKHFLEMEDLW